MDTSDFAFGPRCATVKLRRTYLLESSGEIKCPAWGDSSGS